jgi:hypothetical protein
LANYRIDQDQIIRVWPKSLPADKGCQAGGGRNIWRFDPVFIVQVWNRLWVDQAGEDGSWLTHTTLGVVPLETQVSGALEQFYPVVNGSYSLIQPMRQVTEWSFPPRRIGEWGMISASFDLPFQRQ